MNLRCAKITDFTALVSFYNFVIKETPEMEHFTRWKYGQHPTDAMLQSYIEQKAMYILHTEQK